ncbi:radical SAM protein [Phytomonospora sp. NPDC050363]|uniref:radical SAM protein n=1 Tax=Phytomonospora sp. NPDC050363 TaxID=3155642 RepID=UPI0033FAD09E
MESSVLAGPSYVIWDITYACPLRCVHCYSESGRRPSRQLSAAELETVADALISLRPGQIAFSGGEPMSVPNLCSLASRIRAAGIETAIYTSGWSLTPRAAGELMDCFSEIHISVDGADAATHDRIRGRAGSFERAMAALSALNKEADLRYTAGQAPFRFGIDSVVMRGNVDGLERFCREVLPRFPMLHTVLFGAVVPSGLASREGFARHELLTEDQVDRLTGTAFRALLSGLAPSTVDVQTTGNRELQMHPDLIADGMVFPAMQVEPDGEVRAMPIYEGTVGNLLREPAPELWKRSVERWSDPFVTAALAGARTWPQWAEATRKIDEHFGTEEVRARIGARPAYPSPGADG